MIEGLIPHDHFAYGMAHFDPLAGSTCNLHRFGHTHLALAQSPIAISFGQEFGKQAFDPDLAYRIAIAEHGQATRWR